MYQEWWVEFTVSSSLNTSRQDREIFLWLLWFTPESFWNWKIKDAKVTLDQAEYWLVKCTFRSEWITIDITINSKKSFNLDLIEIDREKTPSWIRSRDIIKNTVLNAEKLWFEEMTLNASRIDNTSWIPAYMIPSYLKWYAVWPLYWLQENTSYRPSESIGAVSKAVQNWLSLLDESSNWAQTFMTGLTQFYERRWLKVPSSIKQDIDANYTSFLTMTKNLLNDYTNNTQAYIQWEKSFIQQLYAIPLWEEFWYIYGQDREWTLPIDRSHQAMQQFLRHTNR